MNSDHTVLSLLFYIVRCPRSHWDRSQPPLSHQPRLCRASGGSGTCTAFRELVRRSARCPETTRPASPHWCDQSGDGWPVKTEDVRYTDKLCSPWGCTRVWRTRLSDVKGVNGKDVGPSRLEVVPEVVVGDRQYHLVSVALLPVQLHKHPGVRAGPAHTACLDCYVVADILGGWTDGN